MSKEQTCNQAKLNKLSKSNVIKSLCQGTLTIQFKKTVHYKIRQAQFLWCSLKEHIAFLSALFYLCLRVCLGDFVTNNL